MVGSIRTEWDAQARVLARLDRLRSAAPLRAGLRQLFKRVNYLSPERPCWRRGKSMSPKNGTDGDCCSLRGVLVENPEWDQNGNPLNGIRPDKTCLYKK